MGLIRSGSFASAVSGPSRGALSSLELLSGWSGIAAIREAWEGLLADYRHPTPGLTWAALDAVRKVLDPGTVPVIACVPDARRPRLLLALQSRRIGPFRVVEPLGRGQLDRHEVLLSREGLAAHPERLFRSLSRHLGHNVLVDLPRLRPSARGTRWLLDGLSSAPGWGISSGSEECQLPLSGGWPRVEASLGLTVRRAAELGRSRLRRERLPFELQVARPVTLEVLDELVHLALPGALPEHVTRRHLLHHLLAAALASRRLRCALVFVGGKLAGGTVAWVDARQSAELLAASDPEFSRWQPQAIADLALIEHLARYERLDGFLLEPHRGPAAALAPEPRPRVIGAPQPGLARVVATAMLRALEEEDALLEGVVRAVAKILPGRRIRDGLGDALAAPGSSGEERIPAGRPPAESLSPSTSGSSAEMETAAPAGRPD